MKILLAICLSNVFIKEKPDFRNGPKILPKNSPGCADLDIWAFDNIIFIDELLATVLQSLETY